MNPAIIKTMIISGIGAVIVILSLLSWGLIERSGRISIKAEYDGFVADAKAIAAVQLAERQRKEKENEERIKSAELDLAAERLRHQADTNRLRATVNSITASQSGKVCYRSEGLNTTLTGIIGLIGEGQDSIDANRQWLASWPK